jgi:hypothetical protein
MTLSFHNGEHTPALPNGTPAVIDAGLEARILRFIFYVAHQIARAEGVPQWTAEGRKRLMEILPP